VPFSYKRKADQELISNANKVAEEEDTSWSSKCQKSFSLLLVENKLKNSGIFYLL